ncbi:WD40 repeat-like protein [Ceratobasidium sp. AG-I]|nr:WD40 repeat-like protein [Ceratobasidium sp. AG-I]
MSRSLRFNICELETSFDLDENIPDLAKKIESGISPELFYACRYWADHLVSVEALDNVHSALEEFLSRRLLFWMEAMNLNRCINIGARGLFRVQAWTQLARDAAGFVTMFSSNPVSRSTPHIYISALPFWPEQRPVSKHYLPKMQGLPKASGTAMSRRESAPLAICTTPSRVFAVAYSTDGARIVSGSDDKTIRVWDAHTGTMIGTPLKGHTGAGHTDTVWSVAYSTDGARIVSGSWDNTIRVWDAHTSTMIGMPLESHTGAVLSVAYSTDGAHIVSGSSDNTIRVANSGHIFNDPCHAWVLRKDGYMTDNGSKLVMWVPSEVRATLLRPQNTAVISTKGSVKVNFTNTHIGNSWARCYPSTQNYNTKTSCL